MELVLVPSTIDGFPETEQQNLQDLIDVFNYRQIHNAEKDKYYEGNIKLSDVNLGLALPEKLQNLEIGCPWGGKTVDVLAARSIFDGFVGASGNDVSVLDQWVLDNNLLAQYPMGCRDELKYGFTLFTLSADEKIGCKIRQHSPNTSAAKWSGELGRISCGFAIIEVKLDEDLVQSPTVINYYNDEAIYVLRVSAAGTWSAERHPHKMGRPLMEPMIWNATTNKPFGRSRLKYPIRRLIDGYVRTIANATIGLEFSTAPQKYLLGVTDDQYDAMIDQKFKQYVGNILMATSNPDNGEKPTFGQLPQGNITPHVEMMRILATQFSAASGLSVTDTGVINNANPTSSEAIQAQTQTLVGMAEQLNISNGDALRNLALMALAIIKDVSPDELSNEDKDIVAHFKNPAMPSVAATTDAALKIASAREGFATTDTFLEMIGFDQASIRRIKAEEQRARGLSILAELEE